MTDEELRKRLGLPKDWFEKEFKLFILRHQYNNNEFLELKEKENVITRIKRIIGSRFKALCRYSF